MRKKIRIISIILLLMIVFVACTDVKNKLEDTIDEESSEESANKEDEEKKPVEGGDIVLPLTSIETLNPITNSNESYFYFAQLIYEGLFEIDENLAPKEKLAKDYSISEEGRVIDVTLKDDVFWHDGTELTASDVVFTLEVIKNAGRNSIYGDMIVEALSPYYEVNLSTAINASGDGDRVRFTFPNGYSNNLEVLTFPIIPKHIFESVNDALRQDDYEVIGTGPFKFESYTKLKEVKLTANENYREGKPYLDEIRGRIYNSKDDIGRAFEIGQVNMAVAKEADWEEYGTTDRMKVLEYPSSNYEFIGFNMNKDIFKEEEGKILRKAIAYSIDKEKIIEEVYLGHGSITDIPLNPNSWLNKEKTNKYEHDKKSAKDQLNKLKMLEEDPEGYLVDENGNRLTLRLLTNTLNPRRHGTAELIRQDLEKIGIEVIIEPEDRITGLTDEEARLEQWEIVENKIKSGDFDMVLAGWEFSSIENFGYMFHSANISQGSNFIGYSDENMNEQIEKLLLSGSSREIKKKNVTELGSFILEEMPYVSLLYKNSGLLMDKNLYGEINPVMMNPYRGMKNLYKNTK